MQSLLLALTFLLALTGLAVSDSPFATSLDSIASANTDIYYPLCPAIDGDCVAPLNVSIRFPGVILLQGGSVDASYYSSIAAKIASQGYIVAVPNVPRTYMFGILVQLTNPNVTLAAKSLLKTLNSASTSGIYQRLQDDSFAIVGHSFGGVMAIVAGSLDAPQLCAFPSGQLSMLCSGYPGFGSGLKAVVTYGGAMVDRSRFGGVTVFNTNTTGVPTVLIRGKNDGRVLLGDAQTTYDSCLETPKAFIELDFANHFGITDAQQIEGGSSDSNPQTKSQDWSTSQISKIIAVALNAHVKGDSNALNKIYVTGSLGPSFIYVSGSQLY